MVLELPYIAIGVFWRIFLGENFLYERDSLGRLGTFVG